MQCPPTFVLPPPLDPDRFPPPSPPKFLKHQVYENPDVFNKVDQHAIQVIHDVIDTSTFIIQLLL